jgi:hypothetical protein
MPALVEVQDGQQIEDGLRAWATLIEVRRTCCIFYDLK